MSYLVRSLTRGLKLNKSYLDNIIDYIDTMLHEHCIVNFYYKVKCFYYNLKWMLPQAWKFRSWDYSFNIELFSTSLEQTGNTIINTGNSINSRKIGRRALFAAYRLRKAYEYSVVDDKSYMYLSRNNRVVFNRTSSGYSVLNRDYKHSQEFYNKLYKVIDKRITKIEKSNKKEAWEYIHKYIEGWWD